MREELEYTDFLMFVNELIGAKEEELNELHYTLAKTAWAMDHDMIVKFWLDMETLNVSYEISKRKPLGFVVE